MGDRPPRGPEIPSYHILPRTNISDSTNNIPGPSNGWTSVLMGDELERRRVEEGQALTQGVSSIDFHRQNMRKMAEDVRRLMDSNFNKPSGPVSTNIHRTTPRVLPVIRQDVHRPRVLKTRPLSTKEVTNKMVEMVKSGNIMTKSIYVNSVPPKKGGKYSKNVYKKVGKKEVLGKDRVIYKMKGSNKEYLKTKGIYIPVTEYKKINITKK